jgi:pseudouridine synthase
MPVRLNKFLAQCGVASRREADRLIGQGKVKVNGRVVDQMGVRIDESRDRVEVNGRPIQPERRSVYVMLNKPAGFLVTMNDPLGRPTVRKLLPGLPRGVVPVGRLDFDSEGLLLLTNDGELAFRLTHPRYEVPKTYLVRVNNEVSPETLARLQRGVSLERKKAVPDKVVLLEAGRGKSQLRLELHEGRKREIRRMLEAVGHRVTRLRRVEFAGLTLKNLPAGQWRALLAREVSALKKAVGLAGQRSASSE